MRTVSELRKGKYVAESDSDDDSRPSSIPDDSDDDFEDDESDATSEIAVKDPPTVEGDEEDDIYGEQISTEYRTPGPKKRKIETRRGRSFVSTPEKSSASSAGFSPAYSLDTPPTSVSSSIRNVESAHGTTKRKWKEIIVIDDSDESEFQVDEEEEGENNDLSLFAPTIAYPNAFAPVAITPSAFAPAAIPSPAITAPQEMFRRRHRQNRCKGKGRHLSQWQRTNLALCEFHPELACIWDELETTPLITPVRVPQPDGLSLQLLPFQLEGLDWLLKQEQQARFGGGILADEMGMGKTIQTIALLLAEPRGKPSLVVAPTVALMQWKSEIETHTNNGLSVCLYYGQNRSGSAKELKAYDVVLTTCI